MRDIDVLTLALTVLSPDELDACFLNAFYRLAPDEQVLIEDVGLEIMNRAKLVRAEEALENVAKLGIFLHLFSPRLPA